MRTQLRFFLILAPPPRCSELTSPLPCHSEARAVGVWPGKGPDEGS